MSVKRRTGHSSESPLPTPASEREADALLAGPGQNGAQKEANDVNAGEEGKEAAVGKSSSDGVMGKKDREAIVLLVILCEQISAHLTA